MERWFTTKHSTTIWLELVLRQAPPWGARRSENDGLCTASTLRPLVGGVGATMAVILPLESASDGIRTASPLALVWEALIPRWPSYPGNHLAPTTWLTTPGSLLHMSPSTLCQRGLIHFPRPRHLPIPTESAFFSPRLMGGSRYYCIADKWYVHVSGCFSFRYALMQHSYTALPWLWCPFCDMRLPHLPG